jgi:hypothetical protein
MDFKRKKTRAKSPETIEISYYKCIGHELSYANKIPNHLWVVNDYMSRADQFLDTFSQIEKWLRRQNNLDVSKSFSSSVVKAASNNWEVRHYQTDLKEYADLRNAIVHERTDGHAIAEPNQRAVDALNKIRDAFQSPALPTELPGHSFAWQIILRYF